MHEGKGLLACSYCGGRFESAEISRHKETKHGVFEEVCSRAGEGHGPLLVLVDAGRVHIMARGGTSLAPIVPEDGWPEPEAPVEVRKVIEKENAAVLHRDGGYLPRTRASLEALEALYHQLAGKTAHGANAPAPKPESALARYLRERWTEVAPRAGTVGELHPTSVDATSSPGAASTTDIRDAPGAPPPRTRCRACDARLAGPACAICGLRNW